jgi:hypothetical protein
MLSRAKDYPWGLYRMNITGNPSMHVLGGGKGKKKRMRETRIELATFRKLHSYYRVSGI